MLTLTAVGKRFTTGTVALRHVDLEAASGEIVAIIGGSGCGKSTLLRIVAGLDPATSGEVRLDGAVISAPHPKVGLVFQEPRLMPWLDVAANVGFGLMDQPRDRRERLVAEALREVGLEGCRGLLPRQLSGGMAQRAALARALVTHPEVLLLDEPFSALDALNRERLQDHLLDLWGRHRPTLLLVTHDVDEALALADRVVVMRGHGHGVERIFTVPIERPRQRTGDAFQRLKDRVRATLNIAMAFDAVPGQDTGPITGRREAA